jgi:hypothetical protein
MHHAVIGRPEHGAAMIMNRIATTTLAAALALGLAACDKTTGPSVGARVEVTVHGDAATQNTSQSDEAPPRTGGEAEFRNAAAFWVR